MSTGQISLQIHMFRLIYWSLHPTGCMPWIILHLWGFLCVRDAGRRGNKITVSIIDFNWSSIQIFKQCDNWLWKRFNWLLWEKSKIPHYNQGQNWLRHFALKDISEVCWLQKEKMKLSLPSSLYSMLYM